MLRAILLGPPGSGKGTQAILLSRRFDVPHVSTGDLFRRHVREGTPLGRRAREYMERGQLVPDPLVNEMVDRELDSLAETGFILDGYPRTVEQARFLDSALGRRGLALTVALLLQVPEEEIVARLGARLVCPNCGASFNLRLNPPARDRVCDRCGAGLERRADDDPGVVRTRLRVYEEETRPLLDFYRRRCLLEEVSGVGPVDEVHRRLVEAVLRRCHPSP